MDFVDLSIRFRGKVLIEDMLPWNVYQVQVSKLVFEDPLVQRARTEQVSDPRLSRVSLSHVDRAIDADENGAGYLSTAC